MPDISSLLQTPIPTPRPFEVALLLTLAILYPFSLAPHPSRPSFSIDYLFYLLTSFLFPPLHILWSGVIGFSLSLLATNKPASSASIAAVFVACFLTALYALGWSNVRLGYGKRRKVDWENEVAVVTGGAGGLGWMIAQILAKKGAAVAVWDVKKPQEWSEEDQEDGGIRWYKCDIGNVDEVQKTRDLVQEHVRSRLSLVSISFFLLLEWIQKDSQLTDADNDVAGRANYPYQQCRHRERSASALPRDFSH